MKLNLNGKYHDVYKKYSKEIITYFCNGVRPKEITEKLNEDFGVNITFQAINSFYYKNKEYIDNCIKEKKQEDLTKIKDVIVAEFCTDKLKEFLHLLTMDLPEVVRSLEPNEKAKLIVSVCNSIAKFEDKDKTEVNINSHNENPHEIDDAVLGELLDVINSN